MPRKALTPTAVFSVAPTALFPTVVHPKKRAFLLAYIACGQVVAACASAHIDHRLHYYWKRTDAAYLAAYGEAQQMLGEQLEEEAFARAYAGSDTLLIFLLKGAMPHKYGDKVAHTDNKGGPLVVKVVYDNPPQECASMSPALAPRECIVRLKCPHAQQLRFLRSSAKRRIIRAGRRSGKTTGVAILSVEAFLQGKRVLYAAPVNDQINRWWKEVTTALQAPIDAGLYKQNVTEKTIELPWTEQRIKGKTAFNADTLRGDYADLLVLDEFGLMNEDAWQVVGAPMTMDRNGDAVFIYTPPSFRSAGVTKAHDPRHAAKLFAAAELDTTGRWAAFHFTSHDNPWISTDALEDITHDMTSLAYRQEILAEDLDDNPAALWTRSLLDECRVTKAPTMTRIVVGLDPGHSSGIVVCGRGEDGHGYVLEDVSLTAGPLSWAAQSVAAYHKWHANAIIAEKNHGGEMVESTLATVDRDAAVQTVWASHGKAARAEPVVAKYQKGLVHHVGHFGELEDQMTNWYPESGLPSPDRLDALVWSITALMLGPGPAPLVGVGGTTQTSHWRS